MTSIKFTWISFFKELSDKLLTYRDRRDDLINKLATVYESIGMSLPKLEADGLQDIDPFTVFGLFNKGITDANRQKIIAGIAEVFDIGADQPTDFEGTRAQQPQRDLLCLRQRRTSRRARHR